IWRPPGAGPRGQITAMHLRFKIVVVLVILLVAGGFMLNFIGKLRNASHIAKCRNNLMQIGLGLQNYHDSLGQYPMGTVVNKALVPDKRLSWLTELVFCYMQGGVSLHID